MKTIKHFRENGSISYIVELNDLNISKVRFFHGDRERDVTKCEISFKKDTNSRCFTIFWLENDLGELFYYTSELGSPWIKELPKQVQVFTGSGELGSRMVQK